MKKTELKQLIREELNNQLTFFSFFEDLYTRYNGQTRFLSDKQWKLIKWLWNRDIARPGKMIDPYSKTYKQLSDNGNVSYFIFDDTVRFEVWPPQNNPPSGRKVTFRKFR